MKTLNVKPAHSPEQVLKPQAPVRRTGDPKKKKAPAVETQEVKTQVVAKGTLAEAQAPRQADDRKPVPQAPQGHSGSKAQETEEEKKARVAALRARAVAARARGGPGVVTTKAEIDAKVEAWVNSKEVQGEIQAEAAVRVEAWVNSTEVQDRIHAKADAWVNSPEVQAEIRAEAARRKEAMARAAPGSVEVLFNLRPPQEDDPRAILVHVSDLPQTVSREKANEELRRLMSGDSSKAFFTDRWGRTRLLIYPDAPLVVASIAGSRGRVIGQLDFL